MSTKSEELPSFGKKTNIDNEKKRSPTTNINEEPNVQRKKRRVLRSCLPNYGYASDLRNWRIFNFLPAEFASQIYMVMAFGDDAALVVTKEKMVYGLGNNCNSRLGIGNIANTLQPKQVEALCGKNIKTFCCNNYMTCVFALTEEGVLYSWGLGGHGWGNQGITRTPIRLTRLSEKCIIDIACSNDHSLALTENGEMYTWGTEKYLEMSNGDKNFKNIPMLIKYEEKIVHIACGLFFNIAITDSGKICSWGLNNYGQLGIDKCEKETNPHIIDSLKSVKIAKVVCGSAHTLALTTNKVIYSWGRNNVGQLGRGIKTEKEVIPTMLKVPEMGHVLDIVARHNGSLAVGEDRRIYIWGQCFNQEILFPIVTAFVNIHDVLAYNVPYIIKPPVIDLSDEKSRILKCLETIFDDQITSDFTIQVEGRPIYVHKVILKIRCRHFRNMFHYNWLFHGQKITNSAILVHDRFSYIVYKAFLKYLYTGIIDLPLEEILELMKLADEYDEKNLKRDCIQTITTKITTANVSSLYSKAINYNAMEVKEFCVQFALVHTIDIEQMENFITLNDNVEGCDIKIEPLDI